MVADVAAKIERTRYSYDSKCRKNKQSDDCGSDMVSGWDTQCREHPCTGGGFEHCRTHQERDDLLRGLSMRGRSG
jgi:hypothetical protein